MKQTSKQQQQQLGKTKKMAIEAAGKKKEEYSSGVVRRKGPWTEQEDMKLVWFVRLFGERRWDFLAKVSGLNRSGKSCRLRWVNYLHPDLKRGRMSPDEERLVVELHGKWGNRWSRIARSMPGRTDNEIKNYWRTHTRKLKHKHQHQHQHQQEEEEEETKVATSASPSTSTSAATSPSSMSSSSDGAHGEVVQEAASKEDEQQQLLYAGMDDGQLLWNDDGIDAYASWSGGLGATSSMMMVPSSPVWQWDDHYCCSTDSLWGHDEAFEYKKMLHSSS